VFCEKAPNHVLCGYEVKHQLKTGHQTEVKKNTI